MKQIILHYGDGDNIEFSQHDPNIMQSLHDDDTGWKARNGLPETYPRFFSIFIELNREWQEWYFEQLKICSPRLVGETESEWNTRLKKQWGGLIKDKVCFTDGHSPQNGYADFINGVNITAGGIGWKTIGTGGNLYRKISGLVSKGGRPHYQIECIDVTKPPPDPEKVNRYRTPWLIHGATVRTKITLPDGRRRIDPFPHGGPEIPYPVLSNVYAGGQFQHDYFLAEWLRELPLGRNRNPYYPPR